MSEHGAVSRFHDPGCTCTAKSYWYATAHEGNPEGHYVDCPLWGVARVHARGRVLNLHDRRAGVPELIMCPRCEGQAFDKGSCGMCGNTGYLRSHDGERLDFVEMVQILATFALATNMDVAPKPPVCRGS